MKTKYKNEFDVSNDEIRKSSKELWVRGLFSITTMRTLRDGNFLVPVTALDNLNS